MYATRTVPPALRLQAVQAFSVEVRRALEGALGESLSEQSWTLAQMGVARGGLGIRDPVRHAGAAYLASLGQTRRYTSA